jgi:hypothetical protein
MAGRQGKVFVEGQQTGQGSCVSKSNFFSLRFLVYLDFWFTCYQCANLCSVRVNKCRLPKTQISLTDAELKRGKVKLYEYPIPATMNEVNLRGLVETNSWMCFFKNGPGQDSGDGQNVDENRQP